MQKIAIKEKIIIIIAVVFSIIFFAGKTNAQVVFEFDPPSPEVGEQVKIKIRYTGISIRHATFLLGDGNEITRVPIICDARPRSGNDFCEYEFFHTYLNPGHYEINMCACHLPGGTAADCANAHTPAAGPNFFCFGKWTSSITVTGPTDVIGVGGDCGDGIVQSDPPQNEQCDCGNYQCSFDMLNRRDCTHFSDPVTGQNFTGGALSCFRPPDPNQCTFDTSGCTNNIIHPISGPTGLYDNPLLWQNVVQFLLYLLTFLFQISLGIVVLMILIGSFFLITGGTDPTKKEKGKKIIIWAVAGFCIIILSQGIYALFRLIMGAR